MTASAKASGAFLPSKVPASSRVSRAGLSRGAARNLWRLGGRISHARSFRWCRLGAPRLLRPHPTSDATNAERLVCTSHLSKALLSSLVLPGPRPGERPTPPRHGREEGSIQRDSAWQHGRDGGTESLGVEPRLAMAGRRSEHPKAVSRGRCASWNGTAGGAPGSAESAGRPPVGHAGSASRTGARSRWSSR